MARCALCGSDRSAASWLGTTRYNDKTFTYLQCLDCRSLFCDPMPDSSTLARMYGPTYGAGMTDQAIDDPKEPQRVVEWLRPRAAGSFVDYGCGGGALLVEAHRLGWTTFGVEFDSGVARAVEQRTGIRVFDHASRQELENGPQVDVLHLGDVLEHLTDPAADLRRIQRIVKRGGYLLAQGPLEANPTLFTTALQVSRQIRRPPVSDMPPYHVTLATAAGQRALFRRAGLEPVEFSMHEVDWPAPSSLSWGDARDVRRVGLYTLRRLSRAVTRLSPGHFGNRYFYVGRRRDEADANAA